MEPAIMDATDLTQFIEEQGIEAEIVFLEDETPTVETAASAVGVDPAQILKSVLFVVKEGEDAFRPLLVVANGLSRISYKKLADYLGVSRRQVRIARPGQVKELTGYVVGTVPPFGHRQPLRTLLDEGVMDEEEVYAGGGAINALIHLQVAEMQRVLGAEVVALSE
jgi:Cys-tRNA(Pro) deacylase